MKTEVLPNLIPLFEILVIIIIVQQVCAGNLPRDLPLPNMVAVGPHAVPANATSAKQLTVVVRADGQLEILGGSVVSSEELAERFRQCQEVRFAAEPKCPWEYVARAVSFAQLQGVTVTNALVDPKLRSETESSPLSSPGGASQ